MSVRKKRAVPVKDDLLVNSDEGPRWQAIYNGIVAGIRAGNLVPNGRIREEEVAMSFGVSRTPVREALQLLQKAALVDDHRNPRMQHVRVEAMLTRGILQRLKGTDRTADAMHSQRDEHGDRVRPSGHDLRHT